MDFVVQKATELGVTRISAVHCEFSVVHLDETRAQKRLRHWAGISHSACEQCGRNIPPGLDQAIALTDFFAEAAAPKITRLMLHPEANDSLRDISPLSLAIELLIGPEGGLSSTECDQALAAGFQAVSMGPRVLRTETAAIAAVALAQALWGDS
jgi:16S rRNA (uracil1498-N3)-methyltransferase